VFFSYLFTRTYSIPFVRSDVPELVNLQNVKGQAKPYQMRQFLKLVEKNDLKLEDE
jgi:hypothetical protein